jgi:hypothetical protein
MVSISNVNLSTPSAITESAPAAAPVITMGAPAAPASKVTVLDERNATVRDSAGRLLKVRRLSALDRVRLFRAMGSVDAENRMLGSYAATAAAVVEIDGMPTPFPQSSIALDALIGRLDEHGLEAAVLALLAMAPANEDVAAEAKGF